MLRTICSFTILLFISLTYAQTDKNVYLNIGAKRIVLQEKEMMWITRTVSDTIVAYTKLKDKNISLGTRSFPIKVSASEVKNGVREFFTDSATGILWTRFTYDHVYTNPEKRLVCINDSETVVHTVNPRIDTIMQINPITLEEELLVNVDSSIVVKYDLGTVKKADLIKALQNRFEASLKNYQLTEVILSAVQIPGLSLIVTYNNADSVTAAVNAISRCASGTKMMLSYVEFGTATYKLPTLNLSYLAVLTLVD